MRDDLLGIGPRPQGADVGVSTGSSSSTPQRDQPSDADIGRFRQAFQGHSLGQTPHEVKSIPSGPFDLFRAAPETQAVSPAAASSEAARLRLSEMVTRLMVGDGDQAPRSVRMTLEDSVMPGVDLAVYEEEGFWVAHFYCRVSASFTELAAPGPDMAVRLSEALRRPCLWRVEGESIDGDDWRRYVNIEADTPIAEYRAQPMQGVRT
jgi:hypothetical protein